MVGRSTRATTCWQILRWGERIAGVLLLLFLSPVLIATAVVIILLSRQSPVVAHRRLGQRGRPFWTLKFRTMWPAAKQWRVRLLERVRQHPGDLKIAADPRITSAFARFCRRFSIDELPQLINVARGEMGFIGPRPLTSEELYRHYGPDAPGVLSVRPGITGLWQINGRSRLSYEERRKLDLILVRNGSPRLYVEILLRTMPAVLSGRDAW
ncbi:MAG TPA: sugar transferase [Bryobacteraceae bacterium]